MDSSGVASLVVGMREVYKVKGSLRLCAVCAEVKGMFEITMLDDMCSIFEREVAAIEAPWSAD